MCSLYVIKLRSSIEVHVDECFSLPVFSTFSIPLSIYQQIFEILFKLMNNYFIASFLDFKLAPRCPLLFHLDVKSDI